MIKNKNLYGLITVIVIIISLFLLVFASSYYLSAKHYNDLADKRIVLLQQQINAENKGQKFIFMVKNAVKNDDLDSVIDNYQIALYNGYYNYAIIINDNMKLNIEFKITDKVEVIREYYN